MHGGSDVADLVDLAVRSGFSVDMADMANVVDVVFLSASMVP